MLLPLRWMLYSSATAPVVAAIKTGTGGIDPSTGRKRSIVKPTGILHLPKKKGSSPEVQTRVDETHEIQAEIAARLFKDFTDETREREQAVLAVPVSSMSMSEIEREISILLRKKLRTEEDDVLLLLLMAAASE